MIKKKATNIACSCEFEKVEISKPNPSSATRYLSGRNEVNSIKWKVRIGIHSGPITAGVVGKKKFAYDVFGDTVNIAARIQSASGEGRINVSAYTHDLIKERFPCEYRGKIRAKGKGDLDMYFITDNSGSGAG